MISYYILSTRGIAISRKSITIWWLMSVALYCFISKTADFFHPFKISLFESPAVTKYVIVLSLTVLDMHLELNPRRVNMLMWLLYKDILTLDIIHEFSSVVFYLFISYSRYFLVSDLLLYVHLLLPCPSQQNKWIWKQTFYSFLFLVSSIICGHMTCTYSK